MANLQEMIDAILARDGNQPTGKSLIIANHLAQLRLFGIRQGIELYPQQDQENLRKRFLDKLYDDNKIDLYLDRIWDLFLCRGQILWYLRPTGDSYRIYYFDKSQFRAYYDGDGNLNKVVVIYDYTIEAESDQLKAKRWVRLEITKAKIIQSESDSKPAFTNPGLSLNQNAKSMDNTLGFIPCVISSNYLTEAGQEGKGEFDWLKEQLEDHEDNLISMSKNLKFFGNPTLVTSRSAAEVTEPNTDQIFTPGNQRNTWASAGQWVGSTASTYKRHSFAPMPGPFGGDERIRRVVGNVQGDERYGYIVPDPVTPDHMRAIAEQRESIHTALGGVDPLGVSSGATAFEIKSLYGRTAATATKKAKFLYRYGLCKVFEMAIESEEIAFKRSLAIALEQPIENITDQFAFDLVVYGRDKLPKDYQPIGLPPLGDRTIGWKWLGPVYEDSPQDILQKSIVVRNLEELGVETIEALEFLFSDKTRKERERMLTGYPFREMNATSSALMQQLSVLMQLLQTPNPYTGQPLGLDMNNLNVIQRTIQHLDKRLSYGTNNEPADGTASGFSPAPGGGDALGIQPANGLPNTGVSSNGPAIQPAPNGSGSSVPYNASAAAAGLAFPGIPVGFGGATAAGAIGQGDRRPEFADPIPVPGGTAVQSSLPTSGFNPAPSLPTAGIPGIPPDLQSSPNIIQQLFPSLFGNVEPASNSGRGKRGGRGKRK